MTNPFDNLEIQFVRSSLATKTDEEIAEVLERPVEEIREFINRFTNGQADQRQSDIIETRDDLRRRADERATEIEKKLQRKQYLKDQKRKEGVNRERKSQRRATIEHQEMQRKKEQAARTINRVYKTRSIDYSKMKTVKVCKGTYVWVDKGIADAEAIAKFHENKSNSENYLSEKSKAINRTRISDQKRSNRSF